MDNAVRQRPTLRVSGKQDFTCPLDGWATAYVRGEVRDLGQKMIQHTQTGRIQKHEKRIIPQRSLRIRPRTPSSREPAREHVDCQSESETFVGLVPTHGQDRARRIHVKLVWVCRGSPFGIEQPPRRAGRAGNPMHAHFPLGDYRGPEIENDRFSSGGHPDTKGIGAEPRQLASRRRDARTAAVCVDHCEHGQRGGCCELGIFADAADVPGAPEGAVSAAEYAAAWGHPFPAATVKRLGLQLR